MFPLGRGILIGKVPNRQTLMVRLCVLATASGTKTLGMAIIYPSAEGSEFRTVSIYIVMHMMLNLPKERRSGRQPFSIDMERPGWSFLFFMTWSSGAGLVILRRLIALRIVQLFEPMLKRSQIEVIQT